MPISKKIETFMTHASWIRRMFEEGIRLKQEFGADNVFDFSLGNPVLEPPDRVQAFLGELTSQPPPGMHRYMANAGYPDVRQAIAAFVARESGEQVQADDVLMTVGAAGALNVAIKSLIDPGQEVLVVAPFFPEYRFYIDNHQGRLKVAESAADFDLDLEQIDQAIGPDTRAVIINSPNNPTGRMYSAERLGQLGELLTAKGKEHGTVINLLSDDPYRKIVYDDVRPPHVFAAYPNSVFITSHSKDLGLAGERIGYAVIHPRHADRRALREAMTFSNRTLGYVNAPALFQRIVATSQDASVPIQIYQELRDLFCRGLERAGIPVTRPQGAFYLFPRTPIPDDTAFVRLLLKHRVLAVPGSGFGRPGHMRLSFCVTRREIESALPLFQSAMDELAEA